MLFVKQKHKNKNEKESKTENPTHSFRETNHMLQPIENLQINSKIVEPFLYRLFCSKNFFLHFCFISMYSVLNKLLE